MTTSLTDHQWQVAHAIARQLVLDEVDVNELGKAIAYLRACQPQPDAGDRFFQYLQTLVSNGRRIGHSEKTLSYYRSLESACTQYLKGYQSNIETLLQILGWTFRLIRYYKTVPISEVEALIAEETVQPIESERQAEIAKVAESQDFQVGQIVEAKVTKIKGVDITYEILGIIKLTAKEHKKAKLLSEGKIVKVEIISLKEDGKIKKVKLDKL